MTQIITPKRLPIGVDFPPNNKCKHGLNMKATLGGQVKTLVCEELQV